MKHTPQEMLEAPVVSAVSSVKGVTKVTVSGLQNQTNTLTNLFEGLATEGVNVDIIVYNTQDAHGELDVGFSIQNEDIALTKSTLEKMKSANGWNTMQLDFDDQFSKVSVVGLGMRSHSGVAAKAFAALSSAGIAVHMISTSEIKISCLVTNSQEKNAVGALHTAFIG